MLCGCADATYKGDEFQLAYRHCPEAVPLSELYTLNYVSLLFDMQYQMLHVCPPQRPSSVIAKNKELSDATGFLHVDKGTLQHVKYSNIFGIGDCTTLPTSKTGAAVGMETGNFFHLLVIIGLEELRETTKTSVRIVVPGLRFESGTSGIKKKSVLPTLSAMFSSKGQHSRKM